MVTAYILILCLSAALATWSAVRVVRRVESLLGIAHLPSGLFVVLSAVGFLVIIAAPARILIGAVLMLVLGWVRARRHVRTSARFGLPIIAVILGISALSLPPLADIPPLALLLVLGMGWLLVTFSAQTLPDEAAPASLAFGLVLLPLATAPLYSAAPASLALDSALLLSPLFAAALVPHTACTLGLVCRLPYAFLVGWLMVQALAHGAYLSVAASALLLLVNCAYGMSRRKELHALQT